MRIRATIDMRKPVLLFLGIVDLPPMERTASTIEIEANIYGTATGIMNMATKDKRARLRDVPASFSLGDCFIIIHSLYIQILQKYNRDNACLPKNVDKIHVMWLLFGLTEIISRDIISNNKNRNVFFDPLI